MPESLNRRYPILQGHLWIARVDVDDVVRTAPPGSASPAWRYLGNMTSGRLTPEVETRERFQIVLGQRVPDVSEVARRFRMTATVEEWNKDVLDLIMRSDPTGDDEWISGGSKPAEGWVRLQAYDNEDAERFVLQGLAHIRGTGDLAVGGEEFFSIDLEMAFIGRIAGTAAGSHTA